MIPKKVLISTLFRIAIFMSDRFQHTYRNSFPSARWGIFPSHAFVFLNSRPSRLRFDTQIPAGKLFAQMNGDCFLLFRRSPLFVDDQKPSVPTAYHYPKCWAFQACIIIAPISADFFIRGIATNAVPIKRNLTRFLPKTVLFKDRFGAFALVFRLYPEKPGGQTDGQTSDHKRNPSGCILIPVKRNTRKRQSSHRQRSRRTHTSAIPNRTVALREHGRLCILLRGKRLSHYSKWVSLIKRWHRRPPFSYSSRGCVPAKMAAWTSGKTEGSTQRIGRITISSPLK